MNVTVDIAAVITALGAFVVVVGNMIIQCRMMKHQNKRIDDHAAELRAGQDEIRKDAVHIRSDIAQATGVFPTISESDPTPPADK